MSGWAVSLMPPPGWEAFCSERGSLFHSEGWQEVLATAFKARTVYGWNSACEDGVAVTVFGAGPFRVGYVGFPIGGTAGGQQLLPEHVMALRQLRFPIPVHLFRVPISGFVASIEPVQLDMPMAETPETAIVELQEWRPDALPAPVRRNVQKAARLGVQIAAADASARGDDFHRCYRDTVHRHAGASRYSPAYFRALVELSQRRSDVRCLCAWVNDELAGFLVAALDHTTAYYLHGAVNPHLQQYRPGDLLFSEAITWAQRAGMACFNMMSSPVGQVSLVRYKEKWGGVTRRHVTYTVGVQPLASTAFLVLQRVHAALGWRPLLACAGLGLTRRPAPDRSFSRHVPGPRRRP